MGFIKFSKASCISLHVNRKLWLESDDTLVFAMTQRQEFSSFSIEKWLGTLGGRGGGSFRNF